MIQVLVLDPLHFTVINFFPKLTCVQLISSSSFLFNYSLGYLDLCYTQESSVLPTETSLLEIQKIYLVQLHSHKVHLLEASWILSLSSVIVRRTASIHYVNQVWLFMVQIADPLRFTDFYVD